MTDRLGPNFERSSEELDLSKVSAAALLRLAADGEVDPQHQARLDEHVAAHPDSEKRVAFERGLRGACGRAMGDVSVPEGLADRVRASIAGAAEAPVSDEALADALADRAEQTRSPSFWSRTSTIAIGSIAAMLLIAVSAVALLGNPRGGGAYHVELAQFVAGEHSRVSGNESAARSKFETGEQTEVARKLAALLGGEPKLPVCSENSMTFGGGSECRVPGSGPSTHFQFFVEPKDGVGPPQRIPVSVFVKKDTGELELNSGVTYSVDTAACGINDASIFVWKAEGLIYALVAKGGDAQGCTRVLGAMNVAPPTEEL